GRSWLLEKRPQVVSEVIAEQLDDAVEVEHPPIFIAVASNVGCHPIGEPRAHAYAHQMRDDVLTVRNWKWHALDGGHDTHHLVVFAGGLRARIRIEDPHLLQRLQIGRRRRTGKLDGYFASKRMPDQRCERWQFGIGRDDPEQVTRA